MVHGPPGPASPGPTRLSRCPLLSQQPVGSHCVMTAVRGAATGGGNGVGNAAGDGTCGNATEGAETPGT